MTTTPYSNRALRHLSVGRNSGPSLGSSASFFPWLTFTLGMAALLASMPGLGPALQYDRIPVPTHLYRIFTCHWTHYSLGHLVWSLGAFIVLGCVCEMQSRRKFVVCLLISSALIPVGLYYLDPKLTAYRGLSGIDSALFFLAAVPLIFQQWRGSRLTRMLVLVLPLLFLAKLLYEQFTGRAYFVNAAGTFAPVPLAHLIGASVGAGCGFLAAHRSRHATATVDGTILSNYMTCTIPRQKHCHR
jgi:rhomboid family GlyGly-CTERM serine protease